jgi:hypothetical protein
MNYITYLLVSLTLVGAWLLGITFTDGGVGAVIATVGTMGPLIALLIYYQGSTEPA